MYSINWTRLIERMLPGVIRKIKLKSFLLALISPVMSLYNSFIMYRNRTNDDINMNGQVRRLEWGLNDRFDIDERRIVIKDANDPDLLFIFLEVENRPVYLPRFISGVSIDFIVCIPIELIGYELTIRAFLDRYKLVSKRYRIEYI